MVRVNCQNGDGGGSWVGEKRAPNDKAFGPEASFGELLSLGPTALDRLGEIHGLVERSGRWPPPPFPSFLASSSQRRGQRRPLALLSIIYRLWAARRKQVIQDWREQ